MTFSTLWIGASGLRAAQKQMEVAGHNVANVATPGYSRQRVELEPARPDPGVPAMLGRGVTIADVIRIRSEVADAGFRAEAAAEGSSSARAELLGRAEQVLGPVNGGVPAALSAFWSAWDGLALAPQDGAARAVVIEAGGALARQLNAAATGLADLRAEAGTQVRDTVEQVNRLLDQIAQLNASISNALAAQQAPNDLLDQRDRLVDEVAALTGAVAQAGDNGVVTLVAGNRALVIGDSVERLATSTFDPVTLQWAGGGPASVGGRIGGLVQSVAQDLPGLAGELDAIALALRDSVNAMQATGFDLTGAAGGPFFAATGAADLGVVITADGLAASASGAPADGNNALALAGLRDAALVGGRTVAVALHGLAGRMGAMAAGAADTAAASRSALDGIMRERAETASVSTDEEMADLVRFQRAYEAAARVLTTADEMLDKLINGTGLVGR